MSDNATPRSVQQGMARLKELLFDNEVETLGELEQRLNSIEAANSKQSLQQLEMLQRVEELFNRAGTQDRFRASVATVLDKALHDAELRNHDELSRAMAPLVIRTIKTELRNSQDELVDIMAPITGRMVKAFVAAEIKKLSEEVNGRIDRNPAMLRVRSLATGRPMSDLAIADSQRLRVDEIFLIRRGSGELVAHWPDMGRSMSNEDIHMSGVLSAINDFASSAFNDDGGSIESFRLAGSEVFLRASPAYLLAAKCNGTAPSGTDAVFNDAFLATLERLSALERRPGAETPVSFEARSKELLPLAQSVEAETGRIYDDIARTSIGGAIVKVLLFLIAVPLLAWFFWGLYTNAEEALVRRSAQHVIDNTAALNGYQTALDVGYRFATITVSGLIPDRATLTDFTSALARELPKTTINTRLSVIPTAPVQVVAPAVDTDEIERRLKAQLETEVAGRMAAIERARTLRDVRREAEFADARLRQTMTTISDVAARIDGDERKDIVGAVRDRVRQSVTDLAALQTSLVETGDDVATVEAFARPIGQVSSGVMAALNQLSTLHGGQAGNEAAVLSPAATVTETSAHLSQISERLLSFVVALDQVIGLTPEAVAAPTIIVPPPVIGPEERLLNFIRQHAIFFGAGTDFSSDADAGRLLDDAAELIKATSGLMRVVGYTDESGDRVRNIALAQNRAERVIEELVRRGVASERLVGIGRSDGYHLSPGAGAGSPNRRVQFEPGFRGEVRTQP